MKNYKEFKENVKCDLEQIIFEEFAQCELSEVTIPKINKMMDGFSICIQNGEKSIGPTFYYEDWYRRYQETGDYRHTVMMLKSEIQRGLDFIARMQKSFSEVPSQQVYENVIMNLVNTERNGKLLERAVHRDLEDLGLSIIYRCVKGDLSSIITLDACREFGLCEEELHEHAKENLKRLMSPRVISSGDGMWVVTNSEIHHGAICMLMRECLSFIADKTGSDLYILPSSIHEVIVFPAFEGFDQEVMRQEIREINRNVVREEDFLSDELYYFDRRSEKIRIAG